jgi:HEAT repeat protein
MWRACLVVGALSLLCVSDTSEAQINRPRSTPAAIKEQTAGLSASDPAARALAACHLGGMGRRAATAVPALMRLLADATPVDWIACHSGAFWTSNFNDRTKSSPGLEASRALGLIGEASLDSLLQMTGQSNPVVRRHVAHALGMIRHERSLPPLLTMAKDADAQVRAEAAVGLGRQGDGRAFDSLVVLTRDPASDVRQHATRALGQLRQSDVVKVLTDKVKDADEAVRWEAVGALGRVRHDEIGGDVVSTLITAL